MKIAKLSQTLVKGFTLIEVMLAIAIFSIAGVALLGTANTTAINTIILEEKLKAGWVASNQMTEVMLERKWPPRNNAKGDVEFAGQTWFWQQKVIKTTSDSMKAIVIEVRLDESDETPISSVMSYVAKEGQ